MFLKNWLEKSNFFDLDLDQKNEFLNEQKQNTEDNPGYERRDQGWERKEPTSPEWREEKSKWEKSSKTSK